MTLRPVASFQPLSTASSRVRVSVSFSSAMPGMVHTSASQFVGSAQSGTPTVLRYGRKLIM